MCRRTLFYLVHRSVTEGGCFYFHSQYVVGSSGIFALALVAKPFPVRDGFNMVCWLLHRKCKRRYTALSYFALPEEVIMYVCVKTKGNRHTFPPQTVRCD